MAFTDAAHANAVGKSLLARLDFDRRMDHLSRHRPIALTQGTITDSAKLFHSLDGHGPHAAQFDVLEYSDAQVCVAVPLVIDGEVGCVAPALPTSRSTRARPVRARAVRRWAVSLAQIRKLPWAACSSAKAGAEYPRRGGREGRPSGPLPG
ncbi:IclR family transcriptional regulator C-terminal domain-containing protein [Streptomyces nojiriensis]|uniref:IclR family transcriptional regulator domain-containing protein n=1 Tax=Streptomyces nojiriensis TaxID=66374 RepID=UPI002E190721